MTFPIFIPSKGRPECRTARLLVEAGLQPTIVIEPEELPAYEPVWKGICPLMVLPENDGRLGQARAVIFDINDDWYWQVDDDMVSFVVHQDPELGRRILPVDPETWFEGASLAVLLYAREDTCYAGPSYVQAMWKWTPKSYRWNRNIATLTAVNPARAAVPYDRMFRGKEDAQFFSDNIAAGKTVLKLLHFGFRCDTTGVGKEGGGFDHMTEADERSLKYGTILEARHPEFVGLELHEKNLVFRVRYDYRELDRIYGTPKS